MALRERRVCVTRAWKRIHLAGAAAQKIPQAGAPIQAPLFQGTLYLGNLVFTGPGGPWSMATADLAIVQAYLGKIANPVAAYASQYGPTQLSIGQPLSPMSVPVTNGQYSDQDLQGWINAMARANGLPTSAAILVLNPAGVVNSDAKESGGVGVLGYHGAASIPYCFVNALGSGFASGDPTDLYAEAVSHEVAEMVVDPRANGSNPEVCDGCGTNCQGQAAFRDYFDANGKYLGSGTSFPPGYPYAFFMSAISKPSAATDCPAPASACAYAPP